jgi:FtsH-binding integral membrane protein
MYVAIFLAMFGLFALISRMTDERVKAIRTTDLIGLLASGLCLGAAIVLFIERVLRPD